MEKILITCQNGKICCKNSKNNPNKIDIDNSNLSLSFDLNKDKPHSIIKVKYSIRCISLSISKSLNLGIVSGIGINDKITINRVYKIANNLKFILSSNFRI